MDTLIRHSKDPKEALTLGAVNGLAAHVAAQSQQFESRKKGVSWETVNHWLGMLGDVNRCQGD